MAYVLGKRESRRLLGDVIVTQQDILANRQFPDACVPTFFLASAPALSVVPSKPFSNSLSKSCMRASREGKQRARS